MSLYKFHETLLTYWIDYNVIYISITFIPLTKPEYGKYCSLNFGYLYCTFRQKMIQQLIGYAHNGQLLLRVSEPQSKAKDQPQSTCLNSADSL